MPDYGGAHKARRKREQQNVDAGDAYCWGSDSAGRLGNGPALTTEQPSPSPVSAPPGVTWRTA